jgi:hypothetical protein
MKDRLLTTERTVVLLVVLHDDQAPDTERVSAAELHWPPFDLEAHGARVVV